VPEIRRAVAVSNSEQQNWLEKYVYNTTVLPVALYGWGTWSLTLREEHRLRVFKNRVLRRIFGPNRDEVAGEWWKFHIEKLHILYLSPNIIRQIKSRRMRWAGYVERMREARNVYKVLVEIPEGKSPLVRPRRRWEDEIRMDFRESGCGSVEWIQLAQDRDRWRAVVNTVTNLRVLAPHRVSVRFNSQLEMSYISRVLELTSE
jgi:hypothetical protein